MVHVLLIFAVLLALSTGSVRAQASPESGDPSETKEQAFPDRDFRALTPHMRLKLWQLVQLPPDELEAALAKWPRLKDLPPEKHDEILLKLQEMKVRLNNLAMAKARQFGLKLSADQEADFTRNYIQRRLEEEVKIWDAMQPQREQMEATLKNEMLAKYGGK